MEKLLIRTGRSYYIVDKTDIDLIRSERNYSRIYCGKKTYIVKRSLAALEEMLGSEKFIRISKSAIVNVDQINEMKDSGGRDFIVVMKNQEVLQWGRKYRRDLVRMIRI